MLEGIRMSLRCSGFWSRRNKYGHYRSAGIFIRYRTVASRRKGWVVVPDPGNPIPRRYDFEPPLPIRDPNVLRYRDTRFVTKDVRVRYKPRAVVLPEVWNARTFPTTCPHARTASRQSA